MAGRDRVVLAVVLLAVVAATLLLSALATRPRAIDFAAADGHSDAIRSFPADTRFITIAGTDDRVPLTANAVLPADEPTAPGRDVRTIAPEPRLALRGRQQAYVAQYNATMLTLVRAKSDRGPRPDPVSRTRFTLLMLVMILPLLLNVYLRYRLAPYRVDGSTFTSTFWDLAWRYMRPSSYTADAERLVFSLWLTLPLFLLSIIAVLKNIGGAPLG